MENTLGIRQACFSILYIILTSVYIRVVKGITKVLCEKKGEEKNEEVF